MTLDMGRRRHAPRAEGLGEDARRVLDWLRQRRGPGRTRVYSPIEIARGLFGKQEGPTPGVLFDPAAWPRVNTALEQLEEQGLVERGRLPQGDLGFRLTSGEWRVASGE